MNILSKALRPLPFYICSGKHDDDQTYFITFDDNIGLMASPSANLLRLYQPSCEKRRRRPPGLLLSNREVLFRHGYHIVIISTY
jgi:hypothetical protein